MNIVYKIAGLALCATILTACDVNGWEVRQFVEGCAAKGGIENITTVISTTGARCADGTIIFPRKPT